LAVILKVSFSKCFEYC